VRERISIPARQLAGALRHLYAAVQLARRVFEDLADKSVVLLGAGKMGELAALHLREAGASSIVVTNRTLSRAEEVAARCSGTAVEFERREEQIAKADVVICSASIAKPRRVDLVIRIERRLSAVSPFQ
jgi:glutamyl-tRNA reductase